MGSDSSSKLFEPIKIGQLQLNHRIVFAPMTRVRATKNHVPNLPVMKEYYTQRASTPGTLLITEGTLVDPRAGRIRNAPGIWTPEQVDAWKEIVDGVHARNSYLFCQLFTVGAYDAGPEHANEVTGSTFELMPSPGATIPEYMHMYAHAAHNAVHKAGFDGVEIHCASGALIDQFTHDIKGVHENDEYGGSVERRSRFGLEIVRTVVKAVGSAQKVGIKLTPWFPHNGMSKADPVAQFTHLVSTIKQEFPDFGYIHVVEPRIIGDDDYQPGIHRGRAANDFLRDVWYPKPYIANGGYDRQDAMKRAEERDNELVAFGRRFTANPDLPSRLKEAIPLTPYDRSTFYLQGDTTGRGYTDFPFATPSA